MRSDPGSREQSPSDDGDDQDETEPRVLLFMDPGRDRELVQETLDGAYRVSTTTDVESLDADFDCCVFDSRQFNRVAGTVQSRRETSNPLFLPFVLLVGDRGVERTGNVWEYVDDVIELPVPKRALHARIRNLVERRRTTRALARREAELAATVEDLTLKERAMDAAPVGITIADAGDGDDPLIYANEEFERITGYSDDVLGKDCRFLQGEATDPDTTARIRAALDAGEPVSVDVLNYRNNGRKFWNGLDIAPIRDGGGAITHFVGFQTEITDRKIRERRLEVLNRVLSHNLRNSMNVIEGHAGLLRDSYDDGAVPESLARIEEAAAGLHGLADSVREIDNTLSAEEATVALDDRLTRLVNTFDSRFPDATLDLTLPPNGPCEVSATGLLAAVEEAVENAIKHHDGDAPRVAIRVTETSEGWVDIAIEDDGPGIPREELSVLAEGETPLSHAERMGLWLIYWVVNKAGGRFEVADAEPRGTVMTLSIPPEE